MSEQNKKQIGIKFDNVLKTISQQIYDTPDAYIRENVQNCVDAVRIQALREGLKPDDKKYRIIIKAEDKTLTVSDNGIGMSESELEQYYWTIGSSGKTTSEALEAGCVGMFGIGGFANFGVCKKLEVISQVESNQIGTRTVLTTSEIENSGTELPSLVYEPDDLAGPRGTVVIGHLNESPDINSLQNYVTEIVQFVPIEITFNGNLISQQTFWDAEIKDNFTPLDESFQEWTDGTIKIFGKLYIDNNRSALVAQIDGLIENEREIQLKGQVRFDGNSIYILKRGFMLCATSVNTKIGMTGHIDCDQFIPTAGRASLDSNSKNFLNRIVFIMERVAIERVLELKDLIGQHTRIFSYILSHNMIDKLDNVTVSRADAEPISLGEIKSQVSEKNTNVFFGSIQKASLNQIMLRRGHLVVLLPNDSYKRKAIQTYLERHCNAKLFDGIIECAEHYKNLNLFEKTILSKIEHAISSAYEIDNFQLVPGKLTEDIPVYVPSQKNGNILEIIVDVRHSIVNQFEQVGLNPILNTIVARFCSDYIEPLLKNWSPRSLIGGFNFEDLARLSEIWRLLKGDIGTFHKGGNKQVLQSSDVQVVNVNQKGSINANIDENQRPRILHLIDDTDNFNETGFYIRLPDSAFKAYGELLIDLQNRGITWAGNKIIYTVSDGIKVSFQYEITLDKLIIPNNKENKVFGAQKLDRPLQLLFGGVYFPILISLESYLVPTDTNEIRLFINYDWIDINSYKMWTDV